jgi:TPR repeat protein
VVGLAPLAWADDATAIRSLAEQGDAKAQFALGTMYHYGRYSIATQQTGDEWLRAIAGSNRDALAPRMTPVDIAEAKRRATEWRAKHGG